MLSHALVTQGRELNSKITVNQGRKCRNAAMSGSSISTLNYNTSLFLVPPELAVLHSQMFFLMSQAKAPATKKTQSSQLKAWFKYAELAKATVPVGGWHLAAFASSLVVQGRVKSADSLANYVSAVRSYHHDLGLDCPTPSQFGPLNRVITGLRKVAIRPTKRSLPVTPTILTNFLRTRLPPPFCPYEAQVLTTYKILALFYFISFDFNRPGLFFT